MSDTPTPPQPPLPETDTDAQVEYRDFGAMPPAMGMATAALVLGIAAMVTGCVCIGALLGVVAIILGIVAIMKAKGDPSRYGGKGRAIGGIITGAVGIVLTIAMVALWGTLLTMFAPQGMAVANLQMVQTGLAAYERAHDAYPPDLQTLIGAGSVPAAASPTGDLSDGLTYFPGVQPADPGYWIVAYTKMDIFGQQIYWVLQNDGTLAQLQGPQFDAALDRFEREYEEQRGQPPEMIEGTPIDVTGL